jgi:hypothetical protein
MHKYIKDGQVAVIVSALHGAGWSTWRRRNDLLFEPAIVDYLLRNNLNGLSEYLKLKYPDLHYVNIKSLEVEWVPEGAEFIVMEYDGVETIYLKDKIEWIKA